MSLASPEKLIWLFVALPIIGFYILKTRLRRRQVATLLFWDQVFEEKRQRSLWQNLRHWLSLLLQLLLVGLLTFALCDPLWRWQTESGQELILVVDNSASMQTIDPQSGRSRLSEAIEQAADVAAGLRQGDSIALITAGSSVRVVVGMTDFAPSVTEALQTIPPTDGPTRVTEAIEAGRRLASDPQRRRIVVFSDACLPRNDSVEADESVEAQAAIDRDDDKVLSEIPHGNDLRWVQVGSSVGNLAITTFQARRSTVDPIGYVLLIQLTNLSDQASTGRLKLELGGDLVDVIPYSLAPNEAWRTTIEGTSRQGGILTGSVDVDDGLSVDNVARAIIPARPMIPVTLISSGETESFYVRTVLESIPLLELTLRQWDADVAEGAEPPPARDALTVYSGVTPRRLPDGPSLFVAVTSDGPQATVDGKEVSAWTVGPAIESPIIATQDRDSPLMRHVKLQNVILDGGRDIEVAPSVGQPTTLLETAEGARVLVSVERNSGRVLVLAADLEASDLPLRIAFPVMMSNAINWFFRQAGEMNPALPTGRINDVPWDLAGDDDSAAVLVDVEGNRHHVTVDHQRVTIGPLGHVGVVGLFTADSLSSVTESNPDADGKPKKMSPSGLVEQPGVIGQLLAVNLCDASESDLRLPELAPQTAGSPPPRGAPAWFYLVLMAIGLVLAEWVLFNRRVVA